jgi:hypothetical protein
MKVKQFKLPANFNGIAEIKIADHVIKLTIEDGQIDEEETQKFEVSGRICRNVCVKFDEYGKCIRFKRICENG